MNVMVYCPLRPDEPRIESETLASIMELEWPEPLDVVFGKEDRERSPQDGLEVNRNITDKYNRARQMVLDGGYDAMLTIEADMIVPPDALLRLSEVDADIAFGLYVSRHGSHPWLTIAKATENVRGSKQMGDSWHERNEMWGRVVETAGVGLGCTLIRHHVLKKLAFRCEDKYIANDWYFSVDAKAAGFTQKHDCGVVCGHIGGYQTYWPDIPNGYKVIEEPVDFREMIDMAQGKYMVVRTLSMGSRFVQPGETIELDEEIAEILLKKGAVKPARQAKPSKKDKEEEVIEDGTDN